MTTATGQQQQSRPQLTAAQMAALVALVEAQSAIRGQLTAAARAAAVAAFAALSPSDWWDAGKVGAAALAALRIVQPNQTQAARITSAYLARASTVMTGRSVRPVGAVNVRELRQAISPRVAEDLVGGRLHSPFVVLGDTVDGPAGTIDAPALMAVPEPRSGKTGGQVLDPADPYGRAADQYRFQVVAKGTPNERARAYALVRVGAIAETDVTLAVREQVRSSLGDVKGVTGYRRILRPELSKSGSCGLCVVAADRIYRVKDLKPIHNRCCCETLPIIGELDPGLDLNSADLDALYKAAGSTGGGKRQAGALKKIRVALAENGELGPVLVDADQSHRGPRDVAKLIVPDQGVRYRAQLDALDESFGVLQRRRAAGDDVDAPLTWHANRINELQRLLAGSS